MSVNVTMKDLLDAGVHFGHQTARWNPKMKPYIFGARNGIYIIDLQKTVALAKEAFNFITAVAGEGRKVLFVGTKPQAQDVVREQAERCNSPYVVERWLGGTLTNYGTIQGCLSALEKIQTRKDTGLIDQMPKKEKAAMEKEYQRLLRNLGGVRQMRDLPGAMFVVDPQKEYNAVAEARCLGIPVIAITDTNCDPDPIDFIIPGNDDALKSIRLFTTAVADAVAEGNKVFEDRARASTDKMSDNNFVARPLPQSGISETEAGMASGSTSSTTDRGGRTINVQVRQSVKTTGN